MGPSTQLQLLALQLVFIAAACTASFAANNTWAVILSSSRYWFNYRHESNALSVYQAVKR